MSFWPKENEKWEKAEDTGRHHAVSLVFPFISLLISVWHFPWILSSTSSRSFFTHPLAYPMESHFNWIYARRNEEMKWRARERGSGTYGLKGSVYSISSSLFGQFSKGFRRVSSSGFAPTASPAVFFFQVPCMYAHCMYLHTCSAKNFVLHYNFCPVPILDLDWTLQRQSLPY